MTKFNNTMRAVWLGLLVAGSITSTASAQMVEEYDVAYESKWEAAPATSSVRLTCYHFLIIPCHEGFDYVEPEGDDTPRVPRKPEVRPCKTVQIVEGCD